MPLLTRAQGKVKEARELAMEFQKVQAAQERLKTAPDDAEANLAIGRFLCFVKSDWPTGLLPLSKGSDTILKGLAEKELAGVDTLHVEIADGWWTVAEKSSGRSRAALQQRAAQHYRVSLPTLSGLNKSRIEKRLAELNERPAPGTEVLITGSYKWDQPDGSGFMELLADGTYTRQDVTRHGRMSKGNWKTEGKALIIQAENWKPEKLDSDGPGKFKGPHWKGGFTTMEKIPVTPAQSIPQR
jgi:hypothetical protein